jgi:tRNA modification GTPase
MFSIAHDRDTIAAVSTAPGRAGIAVVRISGPDALPIVRAVFTGAHDPGERVRCMVYGRIHDGAETVDEALVCYMRAPRSYTGEDVVEIQTHGGYTAAASALSLLVARGARPAEPGEFTKRAFLNGRIDLVQAEAVMEIVSAEGREYLRRAEQLMNGAFSRRIGELLEILTGALARVELNIDFTDQGVPAISGGELKRSVETVIASLDAMIGSYRTARRIHDGLNVVLAGRVNVGKSSLFNTLLGRKRAIVHKRPGTTRDWIEEKVEMDGIPINLIDTAGLRDTDDDVEREGVAETERFIRDADEVLHLIEGTEDDALTGRSMRGRTHVITVYSKSDLVPRDARKPGRFYVSSVTGEGIEECRARLVRAARTLFDETDGEPLVMVERHRRHLSLARERLASAIESIGSWSEEITAEEIRAAEREISSIIGRPVSSDILDEIFKNFCIGK